MIFALVLVSSYSMFDFFTSQPICPCVDDNVSGRPAGENVFKSFTADHTSFQKHP
jgi:hypothetical protein